MWLFWVSIIRYCMLHSCLLHSCLIHDLLWWREERKKKQRKIGLAPCLLLPCGFFDGASTSTAAGVGYSVFINGNHHLDFALGVGCGSNTKAELMGLWALLLSSQMMSIPLVQIYGDSQVIINWAKGITTLTPPDLSHWCGETHKLITSFHDLAFCHIYREHNRIANRLSKTTLSLAPGYRCFSEFIDDKLVSSDSFQLFWALSYWGAFYSLF